MAGLWPEQAQPALVEASLVVCHMMRQRPIQVGHRTDLQQLLGCWTGQSDVATVQHEC